MFKRLKEIWTTRISAHENLDTLTIRLGAVWTVICVAGLFIAFSNMDYSQVAWSSLAALLSAGLAVLAFFAGKHFANLYDRWWANYAVVFIGIAILALISWASYGTHTEDADPMFGGGNEVVDFEPTREQRSNHAARIFFALLVPAWIGVYKGQKQLAKLKKNRKLFEYEPAELETHMLSLLQEALTAKLILVNEELRTRHQGVASGGAPKKDEATGRL